VGSKPLKWFNKCCKAKMPKTSTTEHIISRVGSQNLQKNTRVTTIDVADKFNISYLSVHSMTFVKLLPEYYTE